VDPTRKHWKYMFSIAVFHFSRQLRKLFRSNPEIVTYIKVKYNSVVTNNYRQYHYCSAHSPDPFINIEQPSDLWPLQISSKTHLYINVDSVLTSTVLYCLCHPAANCTSNLARGLNTACIIHVVVSGCSMKGRHQAGCKM